MATTSVTKLLHSLLVLALVALALAACGDRPEARRVAPSAARVAADQNEAKLAFTEDLENSELLDTTTGQITSVSAVVTGDRAVLIWYWTPDCAASRRQAAAMEQFAQENQNLVEVIGVGSRGDFDRVEDFLAETGMETITMLWERSGNVGLLTESDGGLPIQLYSYDLSRHSNRLPFNDRGRHTALDAALQTPWAPASQMSAA